MALSKCTSNNLNEEQDIKAKTKIQKNRGEVRDKVLNVRVSILGCWNVRTMQDIHYWH